MSNILRKIHILPVLWGIFTGIAIVLSLHGFTVIADVCVLIAVLLAIASALQFILQDKREMRKGKYL